MILSPISCSGTGVLESTFLVLITTLDDCVWLVPFVVAAPTRRIATVHALLFLFTLQGLALVLSMGTLLVILVRTNQIKSGTSNVTSSTPDVVYGDDSLLAIVAAVLCWTMVLYLFFKRCRKQKRQQEQSSQASTSAHYGTISPTKSTIEEDTTLSEETLPLHDDRDNQGLTTANWKMVMSLTFLGFLDEVAYFPSLILGGIFSAFELWLGSLLAGLIMLGIVTVFFAPFQPLIQWLDRHVKLHGVVTIFAIILTVQVIVQKLNNT